MARSPKAPRATVEEQLAALEALPTERGEKVATLERAFAERHCRVVAKAARLAEDALLYELAPAAVAAYARFLDKPLKHDPSCIAKKALVRALVALECPDVDFFLGALRYRQFEPVWGGTADTAAELRASAAMGLVASGYNRALVELTVLLTDAEPAARLGAVRAIACGNRREAELLLRAKALSGDSEPQVLGECFAGLLAVEPDESLGFVAGFLAQADDAVREQAALALGESRLDAALGPLQDAWNGVLVGAELRSALLRAAAAHRSEAAFDWLLAIVAEARLPVALEVVETLAIYRHNAKLRERVEASAAERGDPELRRRVAALWH